GRSFVVFGRSGAASTLELSAVAAGSGGFAINGQYADDYSGCSVSGAGDVNGDGLADVVIGAQYASPGGLNKAGCSYVVFGRSGTASVELSAISAGIGGFAIKGPSTLDYSGCSVSAAGDVNGDGLGDLIVGAYSEDVGGRIDVGCSYVVFGRSASTAVELSAVTLGRGGFAINGQCGGDRSGYSVSAAGDVNGDGLADLIVGSELG
ncbi:FG-GAP repeat protein, partial [Azohydromonas lata]|uniref:FG-GAP repeat protein n=1 Tax=Azohydromonas lata TaxID=45677 RepID=UPI000A6363FC